MSVTAMQYLMEKKFRLMELSTMGAKDRETQTEHRQKSVIVAVRLNMALVNQREQQDPHALEPLRVATRNQAVSKALHRKK